MQQTTPLREARQAAGLTLSELAKALKTDIGHLSRVERGEASISPSLAEKAVATLGVNLVHEMQILYPERYKGKKLPKAEGKAPPLRLKVGGYLYALIGAA